jgi:hypothetical protein
MSSSSATENGFPLSHVSIVARISESSSTRSASLLRSLPRSAGAMLRQPSSLKAALAALMAFSTSADEAAWTSVIGWPVLGSMLVRGFAFPFTNSLFMKRPLLRVSWRPFGAVRCFSRSAMVVVCELLA